MASFAIRFYRSPEWSQRFKQAGIDKAAGMVLSPVRFSRKTDAQIAADRVNAFGPEFPCVVVGVK